MARRNDETGKIVDLFSLYEKKMYHIAYAILHDEHQAEDAVMDAFVRLLEREYTIDDISSDKEKNRITREYRKKKTIRFRPFGLPAAASVALICTLGAATVFAAAGIYHFSVNKTAPHKAEIALETAAASETTEIANVEAAAYDVPAELPEVSVSFGYLPEDLVRSDQYNNDNYYVGTGGGYGYYTNVYAVDTAAGWTATFIKNAESLTISDRDAVLIETQRSYDSTKITRDLYIAFPEVSRVVRIMAWGKDDKDELLKIAEQISLNETGSMVAVAELPSWSRYAALENGDPYFETDTDTEDEMLMAAMAALAEKETTIDPVVSISDEEMVNLHTIGESFTLLKPETDGLSFNETQVEVTVKDAAVYDDLSALTNIDQIPESWLSLVDEDGKLSTDDLLYMQMGDGEESLNTIVKRETKDLKLLQVTVEYTNTGDTDLSEYLFNGEVMYISHEDGIWTLPLDNDPEFSIFHENREVGRGQMWYYDQTGGENNNNHITLLKAGESQKIKMAWIVDADYLDQVYLNLNTAGDSSSFTKYDLATGYVDLDL